MSNKNGLLGGLIAAAILSLFLLNCKNPIAEGPSWSRAKILSANEDHPSNILVDGNYVYYVTGGTVASLNAGTNNIKRISLKDGSVSIVVKGGKSIPEEAIVVDDKFLYWSDGGNILRTPKEGGESETVVPDVAQPDELLIDDQNFYWLFWTGEGSPPSPIMIAPKKGGAAKQIVGPEGVAEGLSLDGDFLYWNTPRGIKRVPKSGGDATYVYRNPLDKPVSGLLQDADSFYYAQMDSRGHSSLIKLPKQTKTPSQLAPSINHTFKFTSDSTNVYFFEDEPGSGSFGPVSLRKVSKTGGEPVTLDKGAAGWVKYLAQDNNHLYFVDISHVYQLAK